MNIITRQVPGGFQARLSSDPKFSKKAKSREGAIGNLFLTHRKKFRINRVVWDRKHEWTANYLAGKMNRRRKYRPKRLNTTTLPLVSSPDEAMELRIRDLPLPGRLTHALVWALRSLHPQTITLGHLCTLTQEELDKNAHSYYPVGPVMLREIKRLLKYYGLHFKK